MNESEKCMVESSQSMPVNVSGVALKEIDYIGFESHAFDASDETVMFDHLKKKKYYWSDL